MTTESELPGALIGGDVWSFEAGPARIDPIKMLRIHGYRDLDKVRPVIRKAAEDIARKAEATGVAKG